MTKSEKAAMKAAETLKAYCKSKPNDCTGCIFQYPKNLLYRGCKLKDPEHLPETWVLDQMRGEE